MHLFVITFKPVAPVMLQERYDQIFKLHEIHAEILYNICNTAGYQYSLKHKRSTHEDDYHTCPHYGTVSNYISYKL